MELKIFHWVLNLCIFNTLLLWCSSFAPAYTAPKPVSPIAKLFYWSTYLAHPFILSALASVILFFLALTIRSSYWFIPMGSALNMLMIIFLIANSVVYAKYRFNINGAIFNLVLGKGGGEVVQPSRREYGLFFSLMFLVFFTVVAIQTAFWKIAQFHFSGEYAYAIFYPILSIYLFNQALYFILSLQGRHQALQYTVKFYEYDAFSIYFWLYAIGIRFHTRQNADNNALRKVINHQGPLDYPKKTLVQTRQDTPLNVLIIIVDAWRFDMLCQETMPKVYAFSKDNEVFTNHWSSGNTTQPGVFGLFYSLTPNYWHTCKKYHKTPLLLDVALDMHYASAIYASATLLNPAFHKTIFARVPHLRLFTPGNNPLQRDKKITEDMLNFLNKRDKNQPFFGFLFYDSAHGYYAIPELQHHFTPAKPINHITMNQKTDPAPCKNLYRNALYAIDEQIALVLEQLKKDDLLDKTCIMITGDHGQEFNDLNKNFWEHPSNFSRYQVQVPFILHYPGRAPAVHNYFTTHYDVAPTLLQHVFGIQNPSKDYSIGTDLLKKQHETFLVVGNYTNFGVISHHYITHLQRDGHYQIFDKEMNHEEDKTLETYTKTHTLEVMSRFFVNQ